jgi:predicted DsbA family dithiol-disulfide isomerase
MKPLTVEIWSDVACPWCYVGKRRLESALRSWSASKRATAPGASGAPAEGVGVDVVWRAFELDRSAPPASKEPIDYAARLAGKYGVPRAQAEAMIARLVGVAKDDGLDMRFDRIKPGNTFDAHRLIHLGAERGKGDAMKERLLRAYFTEGEALSEHATLARLAAEVGIDESDAVETLASGAFADDVRADEAEAADLGISGVPFFVIGGRYAVSGAQPAEVLAEALERAFGESNPAARSGEGAACGPAGCD